MVAECHQNWFNNPRLVLLQSFQPAHQEYLVSEERVSSVIPPFLPRPILQGRRDIFDFFCATFFRTFTPQKIIAFQAVFEPTGRLAISLQKNYFQKKTFKKFKMLNHITSLMQKSKLRD